MNDKEREALQAYAAAAAAYEDARGRADDTQLALADAEQAALDEGAPEGLPVVVTLPDGHVVTVSQMFREDSSGLEYTIGTAL